MILPRAETVQASLAFYSSIERGDISQHFMGSEFSTMLGGLEQ